MRTLEPEGGKPTSSVVRSLGPSGVELARCTADSHFFIFSLQPIQDPDPLINCDLMDGRDAFLTLARDKHYEFSSLRRAQFSTLCMLYELHNQGQDKFVYTCNNCKNHVETRYHCTVCDVSQSVTICAATLSSHIFLLNHFHRTLICV